MRRARPRFVCDFYGVDLGSGLPSYLNLDGQIVQGIRVGLHRGPKTRIRVVMDLAVPYRDHDVLQIHDKERNSLTFVFRKSALHRKGLDPGKKAR